MLRLPGENDGAPPLVVSNDEEGGEGEDQAEGTLEETNELGRVKRRRRSGVKEEFDETFAGKEETDPKLVRYLLGSVASVGGILAITLLWPNNGPSNSEETAGSGPDPVEEIQPEEKELVFEAERAVVRPKLVEDELEPIYEKFLNAGSPEEMARWVRHPEITLPRIKEFYGGAFSPAGFSKIVWGEHPLRVGEAIRVKVQDKEFESRLIYAVDEDGWKIDWESWVGWSEESWSEMKESRPNESKLFRVLVSSVSYYNFEFTDDTLWSSYRIESSVGEHSLFAYVPRSGVLDSQLKSFDDTEDQFLVVKIRYSDEALSNNQVIIEEILSNEWFLSEDPS